MWFYKFWLISSLICGCILYISSKAIGAKLKREGFETKLIKYSFFEKLQNYIYIIIPFFNILLILVCLFAGEEVERKVKEKIIKINKEQANEFRI
jgi:hypothetical protein